MFGFTIVELVGLAIICLVGVFLNSIISEKWKYFFGFLVGSIAQLWLV